MNAFSEHGAVFAAGAALTGWHGLLVLCALVLGASASALAIVTFLLRRAESAAATGNHLELVRNGVLEQARLIEEVLAKDQETFVARSELLEKLKSIQASLHALLTETPESGQDADDREDG